MKPIFLTLASLLVSTISFAAKNPTVLDLHQSITDSEIVYPESFEINTQKLLDGWFIKNYTATDDRYRTQGDVSTSDATYTERLAALPTVIDMPYNQIVKEYIQRYTARGREQVAALLGLSIYYMPIFEQALEEQQLPLELKYLPIIESGLDPNAVSRHGAAGLWQFMLGTARGLGMEVSSLVDQRRDPYISSKKAAGYLKDLYNTYNDWSLAIAAYNCGPGTVNKALRRAGGDPSQHDFWSIYSYLSPETRGYVPMFIAANYVMNYYPQHNISPVLPTKPIVTDTIAVSNRVHFNQISQVLNIPVDELRVLNPQYRADIIPGSAEHPYTLILPSQQVHAYIMSEDAILAYEADRYARRTTATPGSSADSDDASLDSNDLAESADGNLLIASAPEPESAEETEAALAPAREKQNDNTAADSNTALKTITHKVVAGESLATIAQKYDIDPDDIKKWNNLTRMSVRVGQLLRLNVPAEIADASAPRQSSWKSADNTTASSQSSAKSSAAKKQQPQQAAKPSSHTVKSGETLSSISKKYGVSVAELQKANGMSGDKLRAGQTLKVPAKGAAKTSSKNSSSKSRSKSRRR